jgi:hypothetical protein
MSVLAYLLTALAAAPSAAPSADTQVIGRSAEGVPIHAASSW